MAWAITTGSRIESDVGIDIFSFAWLRAHAEQDDEPQKISRTRCLKSCEQASRCMNFWLLSALPAGRQTWRKHRLQCYLGVLVRQQALACNGSNERSPDTYVERALRTYDHRRKSDGRCESCEEVRGPQFRSLPPICHDPERDLMEAGDWDPLLHAASRRDERVYRRKGVRAKVANFRSLQ